MSKQRPSGKDAPGSAQSEAEVWRRRIFKNTFTRNGQRRTISGWSVKIQHQGVRRTFSLRSTDRAEAATEARAIHQAIITSGWAAAIRLARGSVAVPGTRWALPQPVRREQAASRDWLPRLLRGRYASTRNEFSVRIERDGIGYFFPLGADEPVTAADRAMQIHEAIARFGWEQALTRFPREATMALHWANEPLAWTYFTFHTAPGAMEKPMPARAAPARTSALPSRPVVAVVESDEEVFHALAGLLQRHSQTVVRCHDARQALARLPSQNATLVMINHSLPDQAGEECAGRLALIAPSAARIVYSIHEDSEALFKSTPGGASGYLLRRTAPERFLAPIEGILASGQMSVDRISEGVRHYFRTLTVAIEAGQHHNQMSRLTRREKEIMDCLSKGYLDKEIAGALGISTWTVHGHMKNIFAKLGVHSRVEAVLHYLHK